MTVQDFDACSTTSQMAAVTAKHFRHLHNPLLTQPNIIQCTRRSMRAAILHDDPSLLEHNRLKCPLLVAFGGVGGAATTSVSATPGLKRSSRTIRNRQSGRPRRPAAPRSCAAVGSTSPIPSGPPCEGHDRNRREHFMARLRGLLSRLPFVKAAHEGTPRHGGAHC
jgi:hypothetical protein